MWTLIFGTAFSAWVWGPPLAVCLLITFLLFWGVYRQKNLYLLRGRTNMLGEMLDILGDFFINDRHLWRIFVPHLLFLAVALSWKWGVGMIAFNHVMNWVALGLLTVGAVHEDR